ncbi:RHS repeat-associated core domain-containing protein [Actinocrispum sp. NPDC049592]|uniref:RHS repeat-associated core domain-containing protein n=1 Tax=Actinocrispum sp. NPDC049592 TaxID=3154835 RepID=UPI00341D92FE
MAVVTRVLTGFLSLSLVVAGVNTAAAQTAPPGPNLVVSAQDSVVEVPRQVVPSRPGATGTGLPQAAAAKVVWPAAGSAGVDVPKDQGQARVGATVVTITQPRAKAAVASHVDVTAFDNQAARRLGGQGTAFRLSPDRPGGTVGVRVDVSGFANAFGGDFESRLRLVAKPACALDTPADAKCATGRPVQTRVDLAKHALTADVPADNGTVYVVAAAPNGDTGSFTATKLASSSRWSVNLQSGDFSWSTPMPKVPAIAGTAPDLNLGYSSQAVDGLTASENAQPSWTGLGWELATPFIERRYNGCVDDGGDTADLCWAGDELMLSLEGTSSELVKDKAAGGDMWRAKQDPGWRVERRRDAPGNGDNDNEYWIVTNPQGTRYTFGLGAQPKTGTKTNSVFTVPVFGDDDGEPCHQSNVENSWCDQAWRWNLDSVVDVHGNSTTYFYDQETNKYARNGQADKSTQYVRGGHVRDIVYSQRAGSEDVTAPARLHFTREPRCTEANGGSGGACPKMDADHASSYPDVPLDQLCTDRCTGDEQKSPTFFTGDLLRSVSAQRASGSSYVDVDRVGFTYSFPKPSDGTSASLWLERFQQTGAGGDGEASLPSVEFAGQELANRVDFDTSAGVPELKKLRITTATDELGRRVDVDYRQQHPCSRDNFPEGKADSNTQDCFPAWRTNGDSSGFGWWQKYLVSKVTVVDRAGGSPSQVTDYRYNGDPAWHYDDDDVTPTKRKTWSDWRGYGTVDVAKPVAGRTSELTRSLFFRGMDGDRTAGGGTKSVSVVDSAGTSLKDTAWLRGKTRETQQFALDGAGNPTFELGGELHAYTSAHTTPLDPGKTNPDDDANLVVENSGLTRLTVIADPGGQRSTRTTKLDTTYDTYGQATAVVDSAVGGDTRCTKTSYARDGATLDRWILTLPNRVRTYAGDCAAPTSLISGKDTFYDGATTLGAPITKGDPTKVVDAVTASAADTVADTVTTSAGFDAYGRTITETDGNGNTATTTYAPATGVPSTVTETNALGHAEVTTLDPDRQQPVSVRDANGATTTVTYDPLGRTASVRTPEQAPNDPPAKVFEYFLDPAHAKAPKVTTKELQSGSTYVTTWSFLDSLGRDRQTQEVSPASTTAAPKTIVTETRYDDAGHIAATSLPVVAAGAAGSDLLAVPGDSVVETRNTYDELGRTVKAAHVAKGKELWAATTSYFGDHIRQTPPPGGAVTTQWTDLRDRLVRREEGAGADLVATTYTYTPAGEIATITDPGQHKTSYTYDLLKRRIETTDPDAGKSRVKYDANGNQTASWDAKATGTTPTLSTDYDKLDRPVTRWAGASGTGTKIATWTYDQSTVPNGIGRLASQTTISGGKNYTQANLGYDPRGRVTGRAWTFPGGLGGLLKDTTYTVNYAYDSADHEISLSYKDGVIGAPPETITTGYDTLGNATSLGGAVTDPLTGNVTNLSYIQATGYAADGKIASRDYANPISPLRRVYAYEPDTQRLSQLQTLAKDPLSGDMHAKQDDTYHWDPAGNTTSIVDNTLSDPVATCYTYDGLARLGHAWTTKRTDCGDKDSTTTADGPAGFNQGWTYSADGNITSSRSFNQTTKYSYNDKAHPHAATTVGSQSFQYDANGALAAKPALLPVGGEQFDWDAAHQLVSHTANLIEKTGFVYAPDGTRMARIDPLGNATLYIDGQEINALLGVLPTGTRFYDEAGVTVAVRLGTGLGLLTWQFNDTQGSAQITFAAGTAIPLRTYYNPYGEIRPLSAPPLTDHGFLGKPKDPTTGLNVLGARYYDADVGRFISTDPANDATSAQTANAYSYGANNPVMFTDPQGLWSLSGAWNWVKDKASKAVDWVDEHKGLIANVAVGIGVAIAVGAVCSTGVGCVILAGAAAGAAGAAAGYGVDVAEGKQQFSWGGLATNVGIGAVTGAAGAGIGAAAGAGLRALGETAVGQAVKAGASAATQTVKAAASKVGSAVSNTVRAGAGKVASAAGKVASTVKSAVSKARPATKQPMGGNGRVLADAEGATAKEIAMSTGGPTGGSRAGQGAVRDQLLAEADDAGGTYTCWRCGQTTQNPANMHLGHRNVPTSRGGNLSPQNVCLEGAACNLSAGNRGAPLPGRSCADRGSCGAPYGRND